MKRIALTETELLILHKTCPLNYLHLMVTIHNTFLCSQLKMRGFVSYFKDILLAWLCVHLKR